MPSKVPLAEVRNFMRHDRGELILGHRILEEPAVDTNDATGYGKGVDGGIVDDDEFNPSVLKLAILHQFKHQAFQITLQHWVTFDGCLPAGSLSHIRPS